MGNVLKIQFKLSKGGRNYIFNNRKMLWVTDDISVATFWRISGQNKQ